MERKAVNNLNGKNSENYSNPEQISMKHTEERFENGMLKNRTYFAKDENVNSKSKEVSGNKIVSSVEIAELPRDRNILSELNTNCSNFQTVSRTDVVDGLQFGSALRSQYIARGKNVLIARNETNTIRESEDPPANHFASLHNFCRSFYQKNFYTTVPKHPNIGIASNSVNTSSESNILCSKTDILDGKETKDSSRNKKTIGQNNFFHGSFPVGSQMTVPTHGNFGIAPFSKATVNENFSISNAETATGSNTDCPKIGIGPNSVNTSSGNNIPSSKMDILDGTKNKNSSINKKALTGLNNFNGSFPVGSRTTVPVHCNYGFASFSKDTVNRNVSISNAETVTRSNTNSPNIGIGSNSVNTSSERNISCSKMDIFDGTKNKNSSRNKRELIGQNNYFHDSFPVGSQTTVPTHGNFGIASFSKDTVNGNISISNTETVTGINTDCKDLLQEKSSKLAPEFRCHNVPVNNIPTAKKRTISKNQSEVPPKNMKIPSSRNISCHNTFQGCSAKMPEFNSASVTFRPLIYPIIPYQYPIQRPLTSDNRPLTNLQKDLPNVYNNLLILQNTYWNNLYQKCFPMMFPTPNSFGVASLSPCNVSMLRNNMMAGTVRYQNVHTFCKDSFQGVSTMMAAVPHHPDLACNSQTDVSEKNDSKSGSGSVDSEEHSCLCKICQITFSLYDGSEDHRCFRNVASCSKPFHCRICSGVFECLEELKKHFRRDHATENDARGRVESENDVSNRDVKRCKLCQKYFKSAEALKRHVHNWHTEYQFYGCTVCGKKFASESHLTNHAVKCKFINNYSGEKFYTCDIGKQMHRYRYCFVYHRCTSSNESISSSGIISERISTKHKSDKLSNDCSNQVNKEPLLCEKSGKPFLNGSELAAPSRTEVCQTTYAFESNLNEHLRATHGGTNEDHPRRYDFRKKESIKSKYVGVHCWREQIGYKPYACDVCSETFVFESELWHHSFSHSRVRSDVYLKEFKSSTIENHMHTHSGTKPFACATCGLEFPTRKALMNHLPTHSGEMHHSCDICGKVFRYKQSLNTHLRAHADKRPEPEVARPYVCEICWLGFPHLWLLEAHRRSFHPGLGPVKCDNIEKLFIHENDSKLHELEHCESGLAK